MIGSGFCNQAIPQLTRPFRIEFPGGPHCVKGASVVVYVDHVRAGVDLPNVRDHLQGQMRPGGAEFVEETRKKVGMRPSADAEIPR